MTRDRLFSWGCIYIWPSIIDQNSLSCYIKRICVTEVMGWIILISEIQKGIVAHLSQTHKLIG